MDMHYINLTNGLDWRIDVPDPRYIRIESTAIEKGDWWRIMRDLDADFLMHVALGDCCHVYDCGTRREMSKTITIGLPWIRKSLYAWWDSKGAIPALTLEQQATKRRVIYFRRYYQGRIRIIGHSKETQMDGNREYWRSIAIGG